MTQVSEMTPGAIPQVGVGKDGFYRINGKEGDGALPIGTVLYAAPVPELIAEHEADIHALEVAVSTLPNIGGDERSTHSLVVRLQARITAKRELLNSIKG